MRNAATITRWVTFVLMTLFCVLAAAFTIGVVFDDPGGWTAVWVSAAWLVPAVALSGYALLRPEPAQRVMVWVTAAVALLIVVQGVGDVLDPDEVGPVAAIAALAVAVPLAFVGLHHAGRAGMLLALTGLSLAATMVLGATPRGSASAVALPVLFFGVLFLVADALERPAGHPRGFRHRPHAA